MNFTVFKKILSIGFIPIIGLIMASSYIIYNNYEDLKSSEKTSNSFTTVNHISNLIGLLQVERGLSVSHLSGTKNKPKILKHRKKVDIALISLTDNLKTTILPPKNIAQIQTSLEKISSFRKDVDSKGPPLQTAISYTKIIKNLLLFYKVSLSYSNNPKIISAINGVLLLEMAKEKSGLLRAKLSAILGSDKPINSKKIDSIISLKSGLFDNLYSLTLSVSKSTKKEIQDIAQRPHWKSSILVFNKIIKNQRVGKYKENPSDFFQTISKVVNDINILIKNESNAISTDIAKQSKSLYDRLLYISLALLFFITFMLIIIFKTSKSITKPLLSSVEVMEEISKGNLSQKAYCKSNDEIGKLVQSINSTTSSIRNAFGVNHIEWVDLETMKKNEQQALEKAAQEKEIADRAKQEAEQAIQQAKEEKQQASALSKSAAQEKEEAKEQVLVASNAVKEAEAQKQESLLEVQTAKEEANQSKEEAKKAFENAQQEAEAAKAAKKEAENSLENANREKVTADKAVKAAQKEREVAQKAVEEATIAKQDAQKAIQIVELEKQKVNEAMADLQAAELAIKEAQIAKEEANQMKLQVEDLLKKSEREASSLNDKVKQVLLYVEKAANGDLSTSLNITTEGPIGEVQKALNTLINSFKASLLNIENSSKELSEAAIMLIERGILLENNSIETKDKSQHMQITTNDINNHSAQVESSMAQLNQSMKKISESTNASKQLTGQAALKSEVTRSSIQDLANKTKDIGGVVKLISSIAQQTNLLALNATIEAARAGEAGKGFQVVATEVKELAKQTAIASEEITGKISIIQSESIEAVNSIEAIKDVISKVDESSSYISDVIQQQEVASGEVLNTIDSNTVLISGMIQEMKALSIAADQTFTTASKNQSSAHQLKELAKSLTLLVEYFQLTDKPTDFKAKAS